MAQKRYINWKDPVNSFELNEKHQGILKSGRYAGFDVITLIGPSGPNLEIQVEHTTSSFSKTDSANSATANNAALITPHGTIIQESASIGGLIVEPNPGSNARIDFIVCEHEWIETTAGGQAATYFILKGPGNGDTPTLPNPEKQTKLAEFTMAAGGSNFGDISDYTPEVTPIGANIFNEDVEMNAELFIDGCISFGKESLELAGGQINNLDPNGKSNIGIDLTSGSTADITGILAPSREGKIIIISNDDLTAVTLNFLNQNSGSDAENRLILGRSGQTFGLKAQEFAVFLYQQERWHLLTTTNFKDRIEDLEDDVADNASDIADLQNNKANITQTAWVIPTYNSPFTDPGIYQTMRYRKDTLGQIHIQGGLNYATDIPDGAQAIFTLPVGFRPNRAMNVTGTLGDTGSADHYHTTFRIGNDGVVSTIRDSGQVPFNTSHFIHLWVQFPED